jgi:hypothetical protein
MIFPLFLIILGVVWLLSALGIISASIKEIIWPLILIALGLGLILKKKRPPSVSWWWDIQWPFFQKDEHDKEKD